MTHLFNLLFVSPSFWTRSRTLTQDSDLKASYSIIDEIIYINVGKETFM